MNNFSPKGYQEVGRAFINIATATFILGTIQPIFSGKFSLIVAFGSLFLFGTFLYVGIKLIDRGERDG